MCICVCVVAGVVLLFVSVKESEVKGDFFKVMIS